MLFLIGMGLTPKSLTLEALEAMEKCDEIYVETYTSAFDASALARIGIKAREVKRAQVESNWLVDRAKDRNVALLVPGDPLIATTHIDVWRRAKEAGIGCRIYHNASIINAITETGLFFYRFGRTATIPFWEEEWQPLSFYDVVADNLSIGAHTLLLLDVRADEGQYMSADEGIRLLFEAERRRGKQIIGKERKIFVCCRMGWEDRRIYYDRAAKLEKVDFGPPPHCLIVPAQLNRTEAELVMMCKS